MAATDMASNGTAFDPLPQWARLSERVENQGKDIVDLRSNMNSGFQSLNANVNALSNEIRNNSRTPWPVIWTAIGVCFAILAGVTTFFYGTLAKGQDRLDVAITRIAEGTVTQQEMLWRTTRGQEDRSRIEAALVDIRSSAVTRNEWGERNRARDHEVADLSRRVDELRQEVGGTYGTRDVILDLKKELDTLRQRLGSMRPGL
jgi:hypothetical protein